MRRQAFSQKNAKRTVSQGEKKKEGEGRCSMGGFTKPEDAPRTRPKRFQNLSARYAQRDTWQRREGVCGEFSEGPGKGLREGSESYSFTKSGQEDFETEMSFCDPRSLRGSCCGK